MNGNDIQKILGIKTYMYDVYSVAEISQYTEGVKRRDKDAIKAVPCRCRTKESIVCSKCSFIMWYELINDKIF
jgi:hypothetical protein